MLSAKHGRRHLRHSEGALLVTSLHPLLLVVSLHVQRLPQHHHPSMRVPTSHVVHVKMDPYYLIPPHLKMQLLPPEKIPATIHTSRQRKSTCENSAQPYQRTES